MIIQKIIGIYFIYNLLIGVLFFSFKYYKTEQKVIDRKEFTLLILFPFFGYGIGDYNDKLKESYKKNNPSLEVYYNSHNQYISFLLVGGLFLLLLYFIFLYLNVKLAIKKRNINSLIILCFYSIVMLSENILERENGVIFFSFFLCFFSLNNYSSDE